MKFKKNEDIIERRIHDSIFLINIRDQYTNFQCSLYEIDEIGSFIWNALDHCNTAEEISNKLIAEITDPVNYEDVYKDVIDYLSSLTAQKFLVEESK